MIYPLWIEDRIKQCSLVDDVIIVGVPDPDVAEEMCVCVVLAPQQQNDGKSAWLDGGSVGDHEISQSYHVYHQNNNDKIDEKDSNADGEHRSFSKNKKQLLQKVKEYTIDFLSESGLRQTPKPRYFVRFDALPKTAEGKYRRLAAKKMAAEKLGLLPQY